MLIRFSVENFLSFGDRQTLSLLPGKGRLKEEHKSKSIDGVSALKTGVIFGANASGKSNLIKAISFGKRIILQGNKPDKPIIYPKFRLVDNYNEIDSRIEYEFQNNGKNYAYGFVFNNNEIKEEWLYQITNNKDIKIFERTESSFDFSYILAQIKKKEEKDFLIFTSKGTPKNQLFLSEIRTRRVQENVSNIEDLYSAIDWFKNSLQIIFPEDKYNEGIKFDLKENEELLEGFENFLKYFDTGISGVCLEKVDFDSVNVPKELTEKIKEDLSSSSSKTKATILSSPTTTYFFSIKDGDLLIEKFMTKHKIKNKAGFEKFDTSDESDGTNRIIDFIPLLIDLFRGNKVFVIDEMERSLHPNLMYDIIDIFLKNAADINSQLILTSHESSLLTQKLLRKDEIWFVTKDKSGSSNLHSLEEYNVRFDKQIRQDYLLGRFKAIPRIGNRHEINLNKELK